MGRDTMTPRRLASVLLIAVAAVVIWLVAKPGGRVSDNPASSRESATSVKPAPTNVAPASPSSASDPSVPTALRTPPGLQANRAQPGEPDGTETRIEMRHPLAGPLTFTQDILPNARNGDTDAMMTMVLITETCSTLMVTLGSTVAEWEATLRTAGPDTSQSEYQLARTLLDTCATLISEVSAEDVLKGVWLDKAVAANHPHALAMAGRRDAKQSNPARATQRLRQALFSGDPEAMMEAGEALTTPIEFWEAETDPTWQVNQLAWLMVGCQAGLACGPDSMAAWLMCMSDCDAGLTAVDAMVRESELSEDQRTAARIQAEQYQTWIAAGEREQFALIYPDVDPDRRADD